jgi:MSHA biogenesis protein MshI
LFAAAQSAEDLLTMRWPWKRTSSSDLLVVSWADKTLAYVLAKAGSAGYEIVRAGVEAQGVGSQDDLVHRLQALGLKGLRTHVMLRPEQYQFLQIDAPAVPPEELRAAARYQIKELVDAHLDDLTLDVMRVGDGSEKGQAHVFVVAAQTSAVREAMELGAALQWDISVVDVQETAQRNLQSLMARAEDRLERATAVVMFADNHQAMITISAREELFYTRRLEVPEGFLTMDWEQATAPQANGGYTPVGEYVPDYAVGDVAYGNDYSNPQTNAAAPDVTGASADFERAQRMVVEVQRSLDLWDRTWTQMPLSGVRVFAGARSAELAQWLGREIGQTVGALDVNAYLPGLSAIDAAHAAYCMPLAGVLLRTDTRTV